MKIFDKGRLKSRVTGCNYWSFSDSRFGTNIQWLQTISHWISSNSHNKTHHHQLKTWESLKYPLQLVGTFKAVYHCSVNKRLRPEVEVNMLLARIFIVCLIVYHGAPKEYCITVTPLEDTQCCDWSCYMLENITLDNGLDITIELIFHPGNHQLSSKLEIAEKDSSH